MDLRPELMPPMIDQSRINEIGAAIDRIGTLLLARRRAEADEAISAFNAETGHDYQCTDFLDYGGWRSREEFALEAARPVRPKVEDVTRDELIEIVRRIQAADPDTDFCVRLLEANTPHPSACGLIFYPPAELQNADAAGVVDAALAYRAIAL